MSAANTRFTINFRAVGSSSLVRVRSVIRGIEQQSYTSFNAFNRGMSSMEKQTNRSLSSIDRQIRGTHRSFRMLSSGIAGMTSAFVFGGLLSGFSLLNRVFIQTNSQMQTSRILIEELLGSKGGASDFVNVMKNMSASFGADIAETMNSSRGLLQVMKQVGKGDVAPKHLDKMLKMVMAVSAMDIENRGLSYTAFSFKEAFQGMGQGDFRSLRNRLEINLGKPVEKAITKAIKSGNLDQAISLFDSGLKRIGIDSEKLLQRLNKEGFTQNISRLQSYLIRGFQMIGETAFLSLTEPFYKLNTFLSRQFEKGGKGTEIFMEMGRNVYASFLPFLNVISEVGSEMYRMRESLVFNFRLMLSSGIEMTRSFYGMFIALGKGLFGIDDSSITSKVEDMSKIMKSMSEFALKTKNIFDKLAPVLKFIGKGIHDIVKELAAFMGAAGGGSGVGGVAAAGGFLAGGIVNGIAAILGTINKIVGNTTFTDPSNPDRQLNSPIAGTALQDVTNVAILGGSLMAMASMFKKGGKVPTAGGVTTPAIINDANHFGGTKVTRNKNNDLNNKIAEHGVMKGDLKQTQDFIKGKTTDIKTLQDDIAYSDKRILQLSKDLLTIDGKLSKGGGGNTSSAKSKKNRDKLLNEERDLENTKSSYVSSRERDIAELKKAESSLNIAQHTAKMQKGDIANKLTLKDQAIGAVKNFGVNEWVGIAVISEMGVRLAKWGKTLWSTAGIWSKVLVFASGALGFLASPIGIAILAIGALSTVCYGIYDWWSGKKAKETEDNIKDQKLAQSDLKKKQFDSFMGKYGFSNEGIKHLYSSSMGGKAPNKDQLSAMLSGHGGKSFSWGTSNAQENLARSILSDALKNGQIDKEYAKKMWGDDTVNSLSPEGVTATMEATMEVSGYGANGIRQVEDAMTRAFAKVLATGKVDINGVMTGFNIDLIGVNSSVTAADPANTNESASNG